MRDREADPGLVLDDRYVLGDVVGRGGSAVVHRAWDRERGRAVAVKLLPPGAEPVGAGGRRESDILAELDHPRLVALHDVLVTDRGTALVMELVEGPSLHRHLLDRGPLPLDEAALVLRDVAAGLAHAHRRGVVHRDVKPGNVLLRLRSGRVAEAMLSDFGIARRVDATRTTAERTVVGTLRFLSPEQARGERVTAASDVYSLGLTVLAALTGVDAFPGPEAESLAGRMLRAPLLPAGLPDDWEELLRGMTALEPDERLDASAVAALASALGSGIRPELLAAAAGPATAPLDAVRPVATVRLRRRRGRGVAAAAGVAVAGALLGGAVALVLDPGVVEPGPPAGPPAGAAIGSSATQPSATPSTAPQPRDPGPVATERPATGPVAAADDRDDAGGRGRGSGHGGSGHGGHGSDD